MGTDRPLGASAAARLASPASAAPGHNHAGHGVRGPLVTLAEFAPVSAAEPG